MENLLGGEPKVIKFKNKEIGEGEVSFCKDKSANLHHLEFFGETIFLAPAETKRLKKIWKNGLGSQEIFIFGEAMLFFSVSWSGPNSPQFVCIAFYEQKENPESFVFDRSYLIDYDVFMKIIR